MKNCDIIIKGKYILTMNEDEIIHNNAVVISDKKIIEIGNIDIIEKEYQANEEIDTGNSIVMPGFINTHTHIAMSYFRGLADDMDLNDWLQNHIWPAEAKFVNPDFVRRASELSCLEMIKAGVTTFNDMYFFEEETAKVAIDFGIRAVLGEGIIKFPTPSCKDSADAINRTIDLIKEYKDNELIRISFAPHSVYACAKEYLEKCKELSDEHKVPLHIHLSESKKENDDCLKEFGKTPTEYLNDFNFWGGNVIAAHGVWLSEADLKILQEKNVKISHNPISNMKLSSGIAPVLDAYKKHKITVSLGSDGPASNNTLDLFSEMRVASLLHKIKNNNSIALEAEKIVTMATIEGARTLQMEDKIGTLEVGKYADIITINLDKPHLQPIYHPFSHLVYAVNSGDVQNVIINGKVIMKDRKMVNIDEDRILKEAKSFEIK